MRKSACAVLAVAAVGVFAATGQATGKGDPDGKGDKVTICHVPPGNPANAHTITVGAAALKAHLAHGDYLGPCKKKKRH